MSLLDLLKKTTIANIVAGIVLVSAVAYGIYVGDTELVKNLAYICAGYLLGITVPKGESR